MLSLRTTKPRPGTFAELLRETGTSPVATSKPVRRTLTPAKSTPAALTPQQRQALTEERRQLEREQAQLKRQLYAKEFGLRCGSFSLAAIAASIRFPWPR